MKYTQFEKKIILSPWDLNGVSLSQCEYVEKLRDYVTFMLADDMILIDESM